MKKVIMISAVVAAFSMTSCKKDYTCTCTVTDNGTVLSEAKYTATLKKSEAEDWCTGNATTVGTLKGECKLD